MNEKQMIQEVLNVVTPELWWLVYQLIATAAVTMALYKGVNQLVAYIFVRLDKEIGKHVDIIYDGMKARIVSLNIKHLIVKFDNIEENGSHAGNEKLIPIISVLSRDWEIIRRKD
jgi:hypothetical protein